MLTILTSKCRSNSPSFGFAETNFDERNKTKKKSIICKVNHITKNGLL